jgi:hypothetical protein
MKLFLVAIALIIGVATVATAKDAKPKGTSTTLTGYLVDKKCATGMAKIDGGMAKARAHERACAMMPKCAKSGYGVIISVPKSATHASDVDYYKFDKAGDAKAAEVLAKSTRKDNMLVEVVGVADKKKLTVTVESIKEHQ